MGHVMALAALIVAILALLAVVLLWASVSGYAESNNAQWAQLNRDLEAAAAEDLKAEVQPESEGGDDG